MLQSKQFYHSLNGKLFKRGQSSIFWGILDKQYSCNIFQNLVSCSIISHMDTVFMHWRKLKSSFLQIHNITYLLLWNWDFSMWKGYTVVEYFALTTEKRTHYLTLLCHNFWHIRSYYKIRGGLWTAPMSIFWF